MKQVDIWWCPVYAITSDGRVWSHRRGKFLKPKIDRYGYLCVHLSYGGHSYHRTIHRLVAEAFIPNPDNKPTVNHKDENKFNNCVDNLEWMTVSENNHYGTHYERSSETQKGKIVSMETRAKISEANRGRVVSEEQKRRVSQKLKGANSVCARKVYCVELDETFDCIVDVFEKYRIDPSSIVKCCKEKKKSAGRHPETNEPLHWRYVEETS